MAKKEGQIRPQKPSCRQVVERSNASVWISSPAFRKRRFGWRVARVPGHAARTATTWHTSCVPSTSEHRMKCVRSITGQSWPGSGSCARSRGVRHRLCAGVSPHEATRTAAIGPKSYRRRPQIPIVCSMEKGRGAAITDGPASRAARCAVLQVFSGLQWNLCDMFAFSPEKPLRVTAHNYPASGPQTCQVSAHNKYK